MRITSPNEIRTKQNNWIYEWFWCCFERGATAIVAVAIDAAAAATAAVLDAVTFATNNNKRFFVLFFLALESAIFIVISTL